METFFKTKYIPGSSSLLVLVGEEDPSIYQDAAQGVSLLCVYDFDWNRYASPWPSKGLGKKDQDFLGQADDFDECIQKEIQSIGSFHDVTMVGYSLAGLFCLYISTKHSFKAVGSVSGSLWYPNWNQYLQEHPCLASQVYLSLGDQEKKSKHSLLSTVEEETLKTKELLSHQTNCVFAFEPGGHFQQPQERMKRAITSLIHP